jgi:NADPH2:quinone reductase
MAEQWADLLPLLESGALDPPLAADHPLASAGAALAAMESRQAAGKLVLKVR